MTVLPDYLSAAGSLLLAARVAAARAVHAEAHTAEFIDLYQAIERAGRRRITEQLGLEGEAAQVALAGIVAGHAVHTRLLFDGEDELADLVQGCTPALWSADLHVRLQAARDLARHQQQPRLDGLARLLRRAPGDELVAASGQLARQIIRDGDTGLDDAWYAVFGTYLLVAGRAVRPAATAMVRAGRTKTYVAGTAGISRSTLDAWLAAGATTE